MSTREQLDALISRLPPEQLNQLLEVARELARDRDRETWQQFGLEQFARAYGPDEPDYSEADTKPGKAP
ncbi:MAG TPA: hypothetical protein VH120_05080 [Gemmataceae bacterium]|jgi:hypothetical protein|nr:hypothetical protein [Gemmataceae bacterium]